MARNGSRRQTTLTNPASLPSRDVDDDTIHVVIETPKGSRNKYAYDPALGVLCLKKVLPAGMAFPYDFGFVPSTVGGDGDPLDVLVLMDAPAFSGGVLHCRAIGVIRGQRQTRNGEQENDRVIAIETNAHTFATVKRLADLGKRFIKELEDFFINYHELDDEKYRVAGSQKAQGRAPMCQGGHPQRQEVRLLRRPAAHDAHVATPLHGGKFNVCQLADVPVESGFSKKILRRYRTSPHPALIGHPGSLCLPGLR